MIHPVKHFTPQIRSGGGVDAIIALHSWSGRISLFGEEEEVQITPGETGVEFVTMEDNAF